MAKISIVIPTWNGRELLEKNLKFVLETGADEILVVDDGSQDKTLEFLKNFSEIKVLKHRKNLGFVKSVNDGVAQALGEIIVLLNNDVKPDKNFLAPLVDHFTNPALFAVSSSTPGYSWAKAAFVAGFLKFNQGETTKNMHGTMWVSGGSAAFDKKKWRQIGGMDLLFSPFYWEDLDICYRAAKRGWKVLWEPESVVEHQVSATISTHFSKEFIQRISLRNQLIFIWKNITSEKMFEEHKKALIAKLAKGQMLRPFLGAIIKLPEILEKRKKEKRETVVSDEEIFAKFN